MLRDDVARVAAIFRDSFNELYVRRGFGQVVPDVSVGASIAETYLKLDPTGCVVATQRGKVVGSAFLHVRGTTAGIGPVTVDPGYQGAGVGRELIDELCRRADSARVRSLRLIQDAFNEISFALYSRAGFVVREVLARASFRSERAAIPRTVRRAQASDLPAILRNELDLLGIERRADHELLMRIGELFVAGDHAEGGSMARIARGGVAVLGPAISRSADDLVDLIAAATADLPSQTDTRLLVPVRKSDLMDRLLERGLEIHSLCTYMVRGEYQAGAGYYVPTLFPESG